MSQWELALQHPIVDDCNAILPLAFIFAPGELAETEGLPLERKHHAKTVRGWLGAGCALALVCGFTATSSVSQDAASKLAVGKTAPANKSTSVKKTGTATPTARKRAATPSSKANSSSASAKAHPAGHSAAGQTSKSKSKTAANSHSGTAKYASARKSGKKKPRGQQKIEPERAQAIQEALIREHYLSGEPTGTWNQSSEDAMRRFQADHGWQSKEVPDSRALISLGLGPSHDHLLNPESAMTTGPNVSNAAAPVSAASQSPLSHSAEPGSPVSINPAPAAGTPATPADHDASSPQ
jgi:hypothetical protein